MPLPPRVESLLGRAMTDAQVGRFAAARAVLDEVDALTQGQHTGARAALCGVRAFAALARGDRDDVPELAEQCVAVARLADEPGWEVFALTLRVEARMPSSADAGVLEDLLAAENALKRTQDPALRSWGHTGLGLAYAAQRLFELALPHQEAALLEPADPFGGLPETAMIPLYNLALTHLWWADELEQLGQPERDDDAHAHRSIAAVLAEQSVVVAERDGADEYFAVHGRLLQLSSSWEDDPAAARHDLERVVAQREDLGPDDQWSVHTSRLAEVLTALGEHERGRELAISAVDALPPLGEPQAEAYVRHTALRLASAGGDRSASAGLTYAQVIARSWWSQRISRSESMRRALTADEMRRRHDHEHRAAREDALTRVGNLRAFEEVLAELESSPRGVRGEVAMIVVDLDRFKFINDRFGHIPGDEALRAVARVILAQTRGIDLVARVGGDEFVVVLGQTDKVDCDHVCERLHAAIDRLGSEDAPEYLREVSVSVGAASTSEGIDLLALRSAADQRMYVAKRRRHAGAAPDERSTRRHDPDDASTLTGGPWGDRTVDAG